MSRTKFCNISVPNSILIFLLLSSLHLLSHFVSGDDTIPDLQKECNHDDHCADFRMKCANQICVCSRLFKWDSNMKECMIQLDELKTFLESLTEEKDHKGKLDEEAKTVFFQLGIAGVFAVVFGAVGALGCVFTFCFISRINHKKKKAKKHYKENTEEVVVPSRPLPPLPPEEGETEEKLKQADGTTGLSQVTTQS